MTTNNHPAHGPVSLDRLHQISEILSKAAAQSDGGNLGYAMADAVKVIDEVLNAEPVAYMTYKGYLLHAADPKLAEYSDPTPLYDAPPAPVAPDDLLSMAASAIEDLMEHTDPSTSYYSGVWADVPGKLRAAMLQAGNHTEQHLDMVVHSGDDNEKNDCRLPFDQWLSQQHEPIDVDCGCVTTEAFYHWLRVAYEAGNSPVTPDGWIPVSERMPERDVDVQVYCADKKEQMVGYMERNETEGWFRFASLPNGGGVYCKPTHWMPLPAEPKQEVKL
ncbi:DUF551 domain-containing protein [Citrobacter freundii]|uniref:DUF551 domain-containing protein n=1 Tax=Citrobacter freundii TaxID=546 RepID=UPI0038790AB6